MSDEYWESLDRQGFPDYSVSSWGRVKISRSGRIMGLSRNQQGFGKISLMTEAKVRITLQVNRLVARAFVMGETETFNTVIHLNGNKDHAFIENLAWRPRWFAVKYHLQFEEYDRPLVNQPVVDVRTGEEFLDSRMAAKKYGLLEKQVYLSTCMDDYRVFPTGQDFWMLQDLM